MNINEYISSGRLEAYVFGSSSEEIRKEAERMCFLYEEVKLEKEAMEDALASYVKTIATQPPQVLKERIMKAVRNLPQERVKAKTVKLYANSDQRNRFSFASIVWAASIALIFGFGINHFIESSKHQSEYAELKLAQDELIEREKNKQQAILAFEDSINAERDFLNFIVNNETELLALSPTEAFPSAKVKVYYNAEQGRYHLKRESLPNIGKNEQYQLWAIEDGKPIDLGVLKDGVQSSRELKKVNRDNIQAFAITLEPYGGSVSPTLEKLVVIGERKV